MPQAFIEYIAEWLATYVFTEAGGYAIAYAVATVVVAEVATFAAGKISQALAGSQSNTAGPPSQTITVQGTTEPRRILYGQVLTAGVVVFDGVSSSTGTTNDYLWFVIAFTGHQADAITDVYLGPDLIPDANINVSTGVISTGKYAGLVNIWRHSGSSADTAQSDFTAAFGSLTNFVGTGVSKMYIRMKRDQTAFAGGPPQNFRALVKGKRVYDPRLDSTNGGSGSQRLADATTWVWSANPALCAADYMTCGSVYFDVATPLAVLGMKVPTARVNWPFVANAANECDQTVALPASGSQARYVLGCVLSCGDIHDANLDVILASMIGQRIFVQGMYRIYAGEYDAPGVSISDSDLTSDGYTVAGATTGTDLYNAVAATYFDPNRDWQSVTCAVRTQSTFETSDGGRLLRNVTLSGVTNEYRAQRICEVIKKQSRNQIVCTLSLKLTGVKVAPWETFNLTLVEEGWQNKVFRAQAINMDLAGRRIVVTAKEESSTPYADPLTTDYAAPGTAAPSFTIEAPSDPTGLAAVGIPYGILFSWNKDPYFAPGSSYQLFEFTSSTPFASASMIASGIQTTNYSLPKSDTIARFYWIRAVNAQGQVSGPDPAVTGVSGAAATVDTNFITAGAVTDTGSAYSASGSQTSATYSGPPTTTDFTIITASYTNLTGATQNVEIFASCRFTVSGAGGGWFAAPRVTGTYPQTTVVGRTAATDEQYAYTASATIGAGATATFTLSAEFRTAGTGSNALVLAWVDAAIKFNILKR